MDSLVHAHHVLEASLAAVEALRDTVEVGDLLQAVVLDRGTRHRVVDKHADNILALKNRVEVDKRLLEPTRQQPLALRRPAVVEQAVQAHVLVPPELGVGHEVECLECARVQLHVL